MPVPSEMELASKNIVKSMKKNMDLTIIDDLCKSIADINQRVERNRLNTIGTMNIAEIMNRHHLENQHSNILAFLIDPKEKHNHKEYGNSFLEVLKKKGLKIHDGGVVSIQREDSTDELRRIDLLIKTDSDFIIIENKIGADDQKNQIADYLSYFENFIGSKENIFIVHLTPFGKEPSEKSISKERLHELKETYRYVSLSYSKDILDWLSTLKTKNEEDVLKAGITQYIDVVKAVSNQRKETFDMNQEISKELLKEYGNLTREQLREKLIAVQEFQNNINLVLFINFFEDAYKEAKGKLVLFCNNKFDYKSIDEWKNDVVKFQERFGVRCYENNLTQDLFVRDLKSNKFVFACKEEDVYDIGRPIEIEGYALANEPGSWFVNAIFAIDNWEIRCKNKLSTHVIKNWFNIKD